MRTLRVFRFKVKWKLEKESFRIYSTTLTRDRLKIRLYTGNADLKAETAIMRIRFKSSQAPKLWK